MWLGEQAASHAGDGSRVDIRCTQKLENVPRANLHHSLSVGKCLSNFEPQFATSPLFNRQTRPLLLSLRMLIRLALLGVVLQTHGPPSFCVSPNLPCHQAHVEGWQIVKHRSMSFPYLEAFNSTHHYTTKFVTLNPASVRRRCWVDISSSSEESSEETVSSVSTTTV